jgi:hypothetical protein
MQEIAELLDERGKIYGDFRSGVLTEAVVLGALRDNYKDEHQTTISMKHTVWLSKIVTKLVRLSVSPEHLDSWEDIIGYATLIIKTIEDQNATSSSSIEPTA